MARDATPSVRASSPARRAGAEGGDDAGVVRGRVGGFPPKTCSRSASRVGNSQSPGRLPVRPEPPVMSPVFWRGVARPKE